MDGLTLREAAKLSGPAPVTLRRHIRRGRLAARHVPGPFGPEVRVSPAALEQFYRDRERAGFTAGPEPRPVESLTLAELARWAEQPRVRMAFLGWVRTAPTVTPATRAGLDARTAGGGTTVDRG
jgi:hypothetical protein